MKETQCTSLLSLTFTRSIKNSFSAFFVSIVRAKIVSVMSSENFVSSSHFKRGMLVDGAILKSVVIRMVVAAGI